MPQRKRSHRKVSEQPNLSEARVHITKAGQELLLAAEGLLSFCKAYVEQKSTEKPYKDWLKFISKKFTLVTESNAYAYVSDLSCNMLKTSPIKEAVEKISNLKIY